MYKGFKAPTSCWVVILSLMLYCLYRFEILKDLTNSIMHDNINFSCNICWFFLDSRTRAPSDLFCFVFLLIYNCTCILKLFSAGGLFLLLVTQSPFPWHKRFLLWNRAQCLMLLLATKRYKCLMLRDRFGAKSPLAMSPPLVARVCHATPCYTMLHYASPCFTMLHHATPFLTSLHHATSCNTILHHLSCYIS